MWPFSLEDPDSGYSAKVSPEGEVYVAPRDYSTPFYTSVSVVDTPTTVVSALAKKRFIVTDILIASDKNFGSSTTAESIEIYEAYPAELDVIHKTFVRVDLLKNDRINIAGLNIATSETVALVATAASINVDITIAGYYIPIT